MRKERIETEVVFKAKGLSRLRAQWLDFGGDLLEPVALLAAGATKAQAAWAGFRGMFLTRVLGPIGMVAGASAAMLLGIKKLTTEWGRMGLVAAANISKLTLQFRPLLGTMELAKKRVMELYQFTARTPFRLGEVAAANKLLQAFTQGALAGKESMELVGDSAARAGVGIEETSRYVGRLYDGLLNGRPVGEATMRLQELSLITGATRNKIESMQAANMSGLKIWAEVEKELKRNKGAMKELSQELEGLQSTHEDVAEQMSAGFSQSFLEGEKAAIKSTTQAMEKMTPVAQYFGEIFGGISSGMAKFKARALDAVTSIEGFGEGVRRLVQGGLVILGAVVVATGVILGKFVVGVLSATAASAQLVKASASVVVAQQIEGSVGARLTVAKVQLAAAKAAVARGSVVEAAGAMRVAVAETVAAARTNALATAQIVLRGALKGTVVVMRMLAGVLYATMAQIVANPWFLLAAALMSVGATMWNAHRKTKLAREELEAYRKTTEATSRNLEAQRRTLETVTDLRKLEAAVVKDLAAAYRELEKAGLAGDKDKSSAARDRVAILEEEQRKAREVSLGSLKMGDKGVEMEDYLRERGRDARMSREDYAAAGPEAGADLARKRLHEIEVRSNAAGRDRSERERAAAERDAVRRSQEDGQKDRMGLMARKAGLEEEIAKAKSGPRNQAEEKGGMQAKKWFKERRDEMAAIDAELEKMASGEVEDGLKVGLESSSEIENLQTQLALYDSLVSAGESAKKAKDDLAGADESNRTVREEALRVAERELAVLQGLSDEYGTVKNKRGRQDASRRASELQGRQKEDLDPVRAEEARQKVLDADLAVARAKVDAEATVAGLRLRGMEAEEKMLGYEQKKLDLALERGRMGEEEHARQVGILQAREASVRREARERAEMLQLDYEGSRLSRLAEEARKGGAPERAKELQKAADERDAQRQRRKYEKEARDVTSDPAVQKRYVESRMQEDRAARRATRNEEQRDRREGRERTRAEVGTEEARQRADMLRRGGHTGEARRVEEEAAREQDRLKREGLSRKYREMGFGGEEADRLAGRQVKIDKVDRLYEQLNAEGKGRVVASSLARIGGGGGVAGRDPNTALLDRIKKILESIDEKSGGEVDFPLD